MRTARPAALLLLLAAAVAVMAALLMPNPPARAETLAMHAPAVSATLSGPGRVLHGTGIGPDLAVLDAAAPDGESLTDAQAAEVFAAADRVCEGVTAGVPEGFMIRSVADDNALPLDAAATFVEAAITRCGAL